MDLKSSSLWQALLFSPLKGEESEGGRTTLTPIRGVATMALRRAGHIVGAVHPSGANLPFRVGQTEVLEMADDVGEVPLPMLSLPPSPRGRTRVPSPNSQAVQVQQKRPVPCLPIPDCLWSCCTVLA